MKHVYFVRHGESVINISDVFATKVGEKNDLGLTDIGRSQALLGGKSSKKAGLKPDLIISSPLKRAKETASIIAKELRYPPEKIIVNDLFVEMQFGELEATSWSGFWEAGNTYKNLGEFEGAETVEQMQQRAQRALEYLRSRPEETILVVSHSAFGRAFRRVIEGKPYTDEFNHVEPLPHGDILKLI